MLTEPASLHSLLSKQSTVKEPQLNPGFQPLQTYFILTNSDWTQLLTLPAENYYIVKDITPLSSSTSSKPPKPTFVTQEIGKLAQSKLKMQGQSNYHREFMVQSFVSDGFVVDGCRADLRVFVMMGGVGQVRVGFNKGYLKRASLPFPSPLTGPPHKMAFSTKFSDHQLNTQAKDLTLDIKTLETHLAKTGRTAENFWSALKSELSSLLQPYRSTLPHSSLFTLLAVDYLLPSSLHPILSRVHEVKSLNNLHAIDSIQAVNTVRGVIGLGSEGFDLLE